MSVRLFLTEDTEHARKMLVDILSVHGFQIVGEAEDGEAAVRGSRRRTRTWWSWTYGCPRSTARRRLAGSARSDPTSR
jgi:hypothetical protein